jgi:hypothetical protein
MSAIKKSILDLQVKWLAATSEHLVNTLKKDNHSALRTMFNIYTGNHLHKLQIKMVANSLRLCTRNRGAGILWTNIISVLTQENHPEVHRLKEAKDWTERFWSQKRARSIALQPSLSLFPNKLKIMREIARNMD